jgi:hypothetical protein
MRSLILRIIYIIILIVILPSSLSIEPKNTDSSINGQIIGPDEDSYLPLFAGSILNNEVFPIRMMAQFARISLFFGHSSIASAKSK